MFLKRILTYSILSLATVCTFFASVSVDVDHTGSILASVSLGESVYAEDKIKTIQDAITPSEAENAMAQKMFNELVTGLNIILAILTAIVSPAIMFAGWLMSPDWTSGDLFNLREPMHNLWVTVSNIVYFIYAILLIIIALGTMF